MGCLQHHFCFENLQKSGGKIGRCTVAEMLNFAAENAEI
jgi:hypothetical protein